MLIHDAARPLVTTDLIEGLLEGLQTAVTEMNAPPAKKPTRARKKKPKEPSPPAGEGVAVYPLDFSRPAELRRALDGVSVLYNTYWVCFERKGWSQEAAVENSRTLFLAARDAGVERIVHVSVANVSDLDPLPIPIGRPRVEHDLGDLQLCVERAATESDHHQCTQHP